MELKDANLALFFTANAGLDTWNRVGIINRELELYKRLHACVGKISFVTYGGVNDKKYENVLRPIGLINTKWHKTNIITVICLLLKHLCQIRKIDIMKTNQIKGSEIPVLFKKYFKKKLMVRAGYLYSYFVKKKGSNDNLVKYAEHLESKAFKNADIVVVTSQWQKDYVVKKYNLDPGKIRVIPNYVQTDVFVPNAEINKKYDLIYVGRQDNQKNIDNLLKAIYYLKSKNIKLSILMVGGCAHDDKVLNAVKEQNINISIRGNVCNSKLPELFNEAKIFILPSYYEGHPKTLLEAMSCGLPCIGADVQGIREDIQHMETGYLCGTDYRSIANSIKELMRDQLLQSRIGEQAREYVLGRYSIEKVLKMEKDVITEVLNK